jgi:tRNA threonylcarbamoyladenosine biosynthesis protein TsaB
MIDDRLTIAIESAVLGGSCCLAKRDEVIAESRGAGGVSRAEDLISDIDIMLKSNSVSPIDIANFVVSAGPGSFTGIRIGIATALGFSAGLGIDPIQLSLLEAMAIAADTDGPTIFAVPAGRGMAHLAVIEVLDTEIKYLAKPMSAKVDELFGSLDEWLTTNIVVFEGHFDEKLVGDFSGDAIRLTQTPAAVLAMAAADRRVRQDVDPLIIAKA